MIERFAVGQIINTHGFKGELKIYPLTDDIKRFRKLKQVYINGEIRNISWCKFLSNLVVVKIEDIDTTEEAIKYINAYMEVERKDAVKLPEGRYFIADLIGCNVFDERDKFIGIVTNVLQTGSNDIYVVKDTTELLIPAIKDVVVNINTENEKITIRPLETWQ